MFQLILKKAAAYSGLQLKINCPLTELIEGSNTPVWGPVQRKVEKNIKLDLVRISSDKSYTDERENTVSAHPTSTAPGVTLGTDMR